MSSQSCSPDLEDEISGVIETKENLTTNTEDHVQIQLGNQLDNPYTVANMQAAFDYYNQISGDTEFINTTVTATHHYIKFQPTTLVHLEYLDGLDNDDNQIILHDYPLDKEITTEGDYYIDPVDENDIYHDIYSIIPTTFQIPSTIPFTILESLYKPSENEAKVETVSLVKSNWQETIMTDFGYSISDGPELDNFIRTTTKNTSRASRYRPNGYIKVRNTETGLAVPARRLKVSIGRGVWWHTVYTNNSGRFVSQKKYRGTVRIRAKFRCSEVSVRRTLNEMLGIAVSDHLMSVNNGNSKTKIVELSNSLVWYKMTTHNGIIRYNDFAFSSNMNYSVQSAIVWAWKNGSSSSTPMLHKYPQINTLATGAGISQGALWNLLANNLIGLTPVYVRPDMILANLSGRTVNGSVNTARIEQLVFHESSHYSHASKAGAWNWAQVFSAEMSNEFIHQDPYHDGTTPTNTAGKHIALAEGWATYLEFKIMSHYYNGEAFTRFGFRNAQNYMTGFDMLTRPALEINQKDDQHFFLTGLFWHLQDSDSTSLGKLLDGQTLEPLASPNQKNYFLWDRINYTPYTNLGPMIQLLEGNVRTGFQLKEKALENKPQLSTEINRIFNSYGY